MKFSTLEYSAYVELIRQMIGGTIRRRGAFTKFEIELLMQVNSVNCMKNRRKSVLAAYLKAVQFAFREGESIPSFTSFFDRYQAPSRRAPVLVSKPVAAAA